MFENYGLKDALLAIWRYKYVILIFALILSVISSAAVCCIPLKQDPMVLGVDFMQDDTETVTIQEAREQFYLEYLGDDNSLTSADIVSMYLGTFDTTSCNQFISDYIVNRMTKEEIIDRLNLSYGPESMTLDYFRQFMNASSGSSGAEIIMAVRAVDSDFASLVVEAYHSWIEELISRGNDQVSITILDQSVSATDIPPTTEQTISQEKGVSWGTVAVLFFVIGVLLGCVIAMGVRFFNPTLNRKSDIEKLGLTVLGEMSR